MLPIFLLTLGCPPPSFHRATHLAVSAPSTQSEVLRMRVYGPSREQRPTQSSQNSSSKTEVMLAVFNTALCGRDTLQWADHAGPEEGFLCLWTVGVERRRSRRRGAKPNFGGRASGAIVMTATHRLPDISNWLTLRVFTYLSNLLNLLG